MQVPTEIKKSHYRVFSHMTLEEHAGGKTDLVAMVQQGNDWSEHKHTLWP